MRTRPEAGAISVALLQPYAPEKAAISRWTFAVSTVALFAFGAWQFFSWAPESMHGPLFGSWRIGEGDDFPISSALVLSIIFFLASAAGIWWSINYPRLVDFFADTENEMTKVSWSSWKEVWGSSVVVIVTVVILGVWIFLVDTVLGVPWGGLVRSAYHAIFG